MSVDSGRIHPEHHAINLRVFIAGRRRVHDQIDSSLTISPSHVFATVTRAHLWCVGCESNTPKGVEGRAFHTHPRGDESPVAATACSPRGVAPMIRSLDRQRAGRLSQPALTYARRVAKSNRSFAKEEEIGAHGDIQLH